MTRTRFAPSPTGRLHLGNLRTALYSWLAARKDGGEFLLRIEDTDRERCRPEYEDEIKEALLAYGLFWDGEPIRQSDRAGFYQDKAAELLERGGCYVCFCPKGSEEECRCGELSPAETVRRLREGEAFTIRQRARGRAVSLEDRVFGEISSDGEALDDQVLIKSDGLPTYNFAHAADDIESGITAVFRGSEFLSSLPKYALLYEDLGEPMPESYSCPPVAGPSGKKLSKRDGAEAALDCVRVKGYPPEAVLNYLYLLGLPAPASGEIMGLSDMVREFDPSKISKSPAAFDEEKLRSVSRAHLSRMDGEEYLKAARPWLGDIRSADDAKLLLGLKTRISSLSEIPEAAAFVRDWAPPEDSVYRNRKLKTDAPLAKALLAKLSKMLEAVPEDGFTEDAVLEKADALAAAAGIARGRVLFPLLCALSGTGQAPGGGPWVASVLGKGEALRRLSRI